MNVLDFEHRVPRGRRQAIQWSDHCKCVLLSRSCCVFVYVRDSCFVARYVTTPKSKFPPNFNLCIRVSILSCCLPIARPHLPLYAATIFVVKGQLQHNTVIIIVHHLYIIIIIRRQKIVVT